MTESARAFIPARPATITGNRSATDRPHRDIGNRWAAVPAWSGKSPSRSAALGGRPDLRITQQEWKEFGDLGGESRPQVSGLDEAGVPANIVNPGRSRVG